MIFFVILYNQFEGKPLGEVGEFFPLLGILGLDRQGSLPWDRVPSGLKHRSVIGSLFPIQPKRLTVFFDIAYSTPDTRGLRKVGES